MNAPTLLGLPRMGLSEQSFVASPFSRTRSRREQFTDDEVKPLLSDLSPTCTLDALLAISALPTTRDRSRSFVEASVANASESQRAWGIKAAFAGKKIREWYDELQRWPWYCGKDGAKNEFQEALDAGLIDHYQKRIEAIKDDMETLEVEELKAHVREAYVKKSSSLLDTSRHDHLDDFTAIITATIVQSLSTLSRLNLLLGFWSTRLIIIPQLPAFLTGMRKCEETMLSAWMGIGQWDGSNVTPKLDVSRESSAEVKAVLQDQITNLGKMVDGMLDLLEGSQDTLPEEWIDGVVKLENEYSSWVVKAEEMVLYNEVEALVAAPHSMEKYENGSVPGKDSPALVGGPKASEENYDKRDAADIAGTADELPSTPLTDTLSYSDESADGPTQEIPMAKREAESPSQAADTSLPPGLQGTRILDTPVSSDNRYPKKRAPTNKPPPLALNIASPGLGSAASASSDVDSNASRSGSATSDYFSNKSSPEIMSASVVTYVGTPVRVSTPAWLNHDPMAQRASRPLSQSTEQGKDDRAIAEKPGGLVSSSIRRERAMTSPPGAPIFQSSLITPTDLEVAKLAFGHARVRSASLQSFEKVPTGNVRKLLIRGGGSYTSIPSNSSRTTLAPFPMDTATPSPPPEPSSPAGKVMTPTPCRTSGAKSFHKDIGPPSNPTQQKDHGCSLPARPRSRFENATDFAAGSTPISVRKQRPSLASSKTTPKGAPGQLSFKPKDKLEARISSILTHIPADIRLNSSVAVTPPPSSRPRVLSTSTTPLRRSITPKLLRSKTSAHPPPLTLTPAPSADLKPTTRNAINEPEVKLYHLHQAGKDSAPVKLYVRLVGETGERVMVRVGGGWADLGEYLREYAFHHGKRSASDARFDIQNPSTPSPQRSRPGTPLSGSTGGKARTAEYARCHTQFGSLSRPSSRGSWTGGDQDSPSLGLAGPKTKKVDISPGKQAWVDDMLDQARNGGSEKRK
ncbi:MAG: hypothetical protein Q9163_002872, partial [Psora crenata]